MPIEYPVDFKRKIIQRYEKGESIKDLSQEFHIAQSTIYHWRKLFCSIQTPQRTYTPKEFDVLSSKLEKMEHEVEIIRLSGFLAKVPLRMKLDVLEKIYHENQQFSVRELCEALGVARGTFYNHIFRRADRSKREEEQADLMLSVQQIFDDSQQRFGAEKIRTILAQNGMKVSTKRISAIMQELDSEVFVPMQKSSIKSGSNMQSVIYSKENLLRSVQTRYGSVILHTLGLTTIGYISASFWISTPAGSLVTEYLVTPVLTWLLPHFEMLIRNAASRKILHFIVIEESSTHLLLLRCFFKRMESNSLFLPLAAHMTTQLLKPFLQHSKKKRHTAESIPQSKAFSKALSNIFDSIMKFVRTKHSNTRRRRPLKRSTMPVLSKMGVQIASWNENNTFSFGDF